MTGIIAFPLLLELSFFLIYDLLRNRSPRTPKFWIRFISAGSGVLFIAASLILNKACPPDLVIADMLLSAAVLAIYPCSFEKPLPALKSSVVIAFVTWYGEKVRKQPQLSLTYEADQKRRQELDLSTVQKPQFKRAHILISIVFVLGMAGLVCGVAIYEWYIVEISGLFLGLKLSIPSIFVRSPRFSAI